MLKSKIYNLIYNILYTTEESPVDVFIGFDGDYSNSNLDSNNSNDLSEFYAILNNILGKYKEIVLGVFGLLTLTLIGLLIYLFVCLGNSGDNPRDRKNVIVRIITCGIALAVFGSFTVIFGLFFNSFH